MQLKKVLFLIFVIGVPLLLMVSIYDRYHQYEIWKNSVLEDFIIYKSKKKNKKKYKKIHVNYESPLALGEYWKMLTTPDGAKNPEYPDGYLEEARQMLNKQNRNARIDPLIFVERGPANAPGRTRSILTLPSTGTQKRWLAASVTGGIWESNDEGVSWSHITTDTNSLSVSTMCASADGNTIYAGTGEYFSNVTNGLGVLKSTNGGRTWSFLVSTENNTDFSNVNRIICSSSNPNIVLAATASRIEVFNTFGHIMRSENGGNTWEKKVLSKSASLNQIIASNDFNKMYATDGNGDFYKSADQGKTWKYTYSFKSSRVEIALSKINEKVIYAQVNDAGSFTDTYPFIWVSYDEGEIFHNAKQHVSNKGNTEKDINYLGNQGHYDNTIMVHPYDENAIYHGGVNLFFSTFTKVDNNAKRYVIYQTPNPFINFIAHNGVINHEDVQIDNNIDDSNLRTFEFRFGNKMQKAHRFTVGNRTSEVPDEDYTYRDYVNIPFEVWDTQSNRKLMVSFRDQNNNGTWDLEPLDININTSATSQTREYLYIHTNAYSDTPNEGIAKNGGINIDRMCIIWPTLHSTFSEFDSNVTRTVEFKLTKRLDVTITSVDVADAYGGRSGLNSYNQTSNDNSGVHPDHHHLSAILESSGNQWRLLVGNDGGIYVSKSAEIPGIQKGDFFFRGQSYNTTQFYSVDKHPTQDRYVGGSQDNGSWMTPKNISADKATKYNVVYGGDGFEAIWNPTNPDKIIVTSQRGDITISKDGGQTFKHANNLPARGTNKFPFYTQIGYSKASPESLIIMGEGGIYVSNNFGDTWAKKDPNSTFLYNNNSKSAISLANPSYIWTGGGFGSKHNTYLSTDKGETFNVVAEYNRVRLGSTTGIYTHPLEKNTAYMLFSFYSRPKVLKTTNAGESWIDISGFDSQDLPTASSKQFPNVRVYSLLILPPDGKIWVSTELGIIESTDDGQSWHKLVTNLPNIPMYQMKLVGNQIVLASYGRGIWTYTNSFNYSIAQPPFINKVGISPSNNYIIDINIRTSYDKLKFFINDTLVLTENNVAANPNLIKKIMSRNVENETVKIKLIAEKEGFEMYSNTITYIAKPVDTNQITSYQNNLDNVDDWLIDNMNFGSRTFNGKNTIETPHPLPIGYQGTALLLKTFIKDTDFPQLYFGNIALLKQISENNNLTLNDNIFAQLEYSYDGIQWQPVQKKYNVSTTEDSFHAYRIGDVNPRISHASSTQLSLENILDDKPFLLRFHIVNNLIENTNPWGFVLYNLYVQTKIVGVSNENFDNNNYSIYPNPADTSLNISLSEIPTSNVFIVINDINGIEKMRILLEESKININIYSLTIPYLENGVYALTIVNQSDVLYKDKLIIQH